MSSYPYDVKFTVGSTEYGFMLASPPGQSKTLNFEEAGRPDAMRVMTADVATHQDFDPIKDTVFAQGSWEDGLGQLEFTPETENAYWWGTVVTQVPGKVFLPPPTTSLSMTTSVSAPVLGMTTWIASDGTRYDFCWAGHRLYRRTTGNWSHIYSEPNTKTITDFKLYKGDGYIAVPSSTDDTQDYVRITNANLTGSTSAKVATTMFSTGLKPKYFLTVRGTFYAVVDNDKVYYTVDPSVDSWVGPIDTDLAGTNNAGGKPGDGTSPFQGMRAASDYLMVFTREAGYNIDSGQDVTEIIWQWKERPSARNFEFTAAADDFVFYSAQNEVYAYEPSTGTTVPLRLSKASGFSLKQIYGLAADGRYVFVLAKVRVPTLRSADSMALLVCYRSGPYRWTPQCWWEDTSITETYYGLYASPSGTGTRLYWGATASSVTSTNTMLVPEDFDFSSGGSFATSGELYCSIARSGFPGFSKLALWTGMSANNLSAGSRTIAIKYSTDMGANYSTLSTIASDETTNAYSDITARSIALRFTLTGTATDSPVLRSFDHHQRVRFRYLPSAMMGIRIGDYLELLGGGRASETKEKLVENLKFLRTTANESGNWVQYEDFLGNIFDCTVDMITFRPTTHESPIDEYEMEAMVAITQAYKGD